MGGNSEPAGGPDWRAMLAGEDAKALETISRYKTPGEFTKAFLEQRSALAKKSEPVKLADNATPEQIAEYRKGLGVPELAKDAPTEKVLEAYGIKIPDGYQASEVEKGMLGDYAKLAYEQGHSPREVKAATDFFFRQQAANAQAINAINVTKQKEWTGALKDELGKDFEPMIAAGETYLNQLFGDDQAAKNAMLNASLPGGGKLGDHPQFIKMAVDLALKNGLTDKIETAALESSGKSILTQRDELMALNRTNPKLYNDPKTQAQIDKLNALLVKQGAQDEFGNPTGRR